MLIYIQSTSSAIVDNANARRDEIDGKHLLGSKILEYIDQVVRCVRSGGEYAGMKACQIRIWSLGELHKPGQETDDCKKLGILIEVSSVQYLNPRRIKLTVTELYCSRIKFLNSVFTEVKKASYI